MRVTRLLEDDVQRVSFLLLPIQVRIAQNVIIAFNCFWSQIKGVRVAIFMRKIQLYEPSSFFTISILPKLDFSENSRICFLFCMKDEIGL